MQSQKEEELQRIWADTFKALGVGGLSDEDAAQQSLSKITLNQRSPDHDQNSTFKGKQAARKRLENGQIFSRLEKLGDPELRQGVEDARRWLDTQDADHEANASTTVSTLLQRLFGEKNFQTLIDSDAPKADTAKAQVQPQPPKDVGQEPTPDNSLDPTTPQPMNQPPMNGSPGQQPQIASPFMPPRPTNPMPPKPAGAEMGLF